MSDNISAPRRSTRTPQSEGTPFRLMSCFFFKKSYPQIACLQCSQCDQLEIEYNLANGGKITKLRDKPPKRLWCNRMKEGLSEWQPFSESDVYNQIADISTVRATAVSTSVNPNCMDSSSESDEVDSTGTVVQRSVRANRERFSVIRQKSKQTDILTKKVASLKIP